MAAIVRVKRRREEEPVESLLIACKKPRPDDSMVAETNEIQCRAKFAGTVNEKDERITLRVREAIRKEKLQKECQRQNEYLVSSGAVPRPRRRKDPAARKPVAKQTSYKVVGQKRALDLDSLDKELHEESGPSKEKVCKDEPNAEGNRKFHLYDVIPERRQEECEKEVQQAPSASQEIVTCNGIPMIREKVAPPTNSSSTLETDRDYVYDIYYLNSPQFDFRVLQDILVVEACRGELNIGEYQKSDEEVYEDEDDSNEEDNWRNDYPEEDPHFYENDAEYVNSTELEWGFGGEEDLNIEMNHLQLDDQYRGDISSDEEDQEIYRQSMYSSYGNRQLTSYDQYLTRVQKELDHDGDDENESD